MASLITSYFLLLNINSLKMNTNELIEAWWKIKCHSVTIWTIRFVACNMSVTTSEVVCMIITYRKSKDQPDKVANPARGQLTRENERIPVAICA